MFFYLTKSWLTGKDPDSGEDWGQEEKGQLLACEAVWIQVK